MDRKVSPMLFSAPMVRALLAGAKTQTRRVLKPQPPEWATFCKEGEMRNSSGQWVRTQLWYWSEPEQVPPRPLRRWPVTAEGDHFWMNQKHQVGDVLWVRESGTLLREAYDHDPILQKALWQDAGFQHAADGIIVAARDYDTPIAEWIGNCSQTSRPSIHMPRWASRITLVVTDVRVQRLQEISEEDAIAEGIEKVFYDGEDDRFIGQWGWRDYRDHPHAIAPFHQNDPRLSYETLWRKIHGPKAWDANPWVAAYTFNIHPVNVDVYLKEHPG